MSNDVLEVRIAEGFAWCTALLCIAVFIATSLLTYNMFTRVMDSLECPAPTYQVEKPEAK